MLTPRPTSHRGPTAGESGKYNLGPVMVGVTGPNPYQMGAIVDAQIELDKPVDVFAVEADRRMKRRRVQRGGRVPVRDQDHLMLSDRNILINMALDHCEGEGDWQLCASDQCVVGEDDE